MFSKIYETLRDSTRCVLPVMHLQVHNWLVFLGRTVNITLKVTDVKDVPTVSMVTPLQEQPLTVDPVLAP